MSLDATRRGFLGAASALPAAGARAVIAEPGLVLIDPRPSFALSPQLYMQFMEPLGVTDSAVEAAWDRDADDWREDFIAAVADLAPGAIRFGGLFSRYYKWREGVGPPAERPWMRNHAWGGLESNRVGTAELARLCRRAGAEPLLCVNFMGDGQARYARTANGDRTGDAREAADWVAYANDPDHALRRLHGSAEPFGIGLWQIGNETSYDEGCFAKDEAIARTAEFAAAMKARDPSIRLIGWGDRGWGARAGSEPELWAGDMLARAGEHLDLIAIHMMQQVPRRADSMLHGLAYERDPARAWEELIELSGGIEARLVELEQVLDAGGHQAGIAVTEGHLSLQPHNTNPILLEWLTGVYHARAMNLYERHGRRVRLATAADFNGTRWTVVAVREPVPRGPSYLTPAGAVMRLFGRHRGEAAVTLRAAPAELDIAASRRGERLYLHVANLCYGRSVEAGFAVPGGAILGGRVLEIAPEDPRQAAGQDEPDAFAPRERKLPPGPAPRWRFPAASVSVVELELAPA